MGIQFFKIDFGSMFRLENVTAKLYIEFGLGVIFIQFWIQSFYKTLFSFELNMFPSFLNFSTMNRKTQKSKYYT